MRRATGEAPFLHAPKIRDRVCRAFAQDRDERHLHRGVVQDALRHHPVVAAHLPVVARVDHAGFLRKARVTQRAQHVADVLVHRRHEPGVAGDRAPDVGLRREVRDLGEATVAQIDRKREVPLRPARQPRDEHFERWLALFTETVDELYEGPVADLAKAEAFFARVFGRPSTPLATMSRDAPPRWDTLCQGSRKGACHTSFDSRIGAFFCRPPLALARCCPFNSRFRRGGVPRRLDC